jgi:hypothetical protein
VSDWSSGNGFHISAVVLPAGRIGAVSLPLTDCDCVPGEGNPMLGNLCPNRQRRGMVDRLCDVCGGGFAPRESYYFMGKHSMMMEHGGRGGFHECPVHRDCALYAGRVCPGLVTKAMNVGVFRCSDYTLIPQVSKVDNQGRGVHYKGLDDPAFLAAVEQRRLDRSLITILGRPIRPTIHHLDTWIRRELRKADHV